MAINPEIWLMYSDIRQESLPSIVTLLSSAWDLMQAQSTCPSLEVLDQEVIAPTFAMGGWVAVYQNQHGEVVGFAAAHYQEVAYFDLIEPLPFGTYLEINALIANRDDSPRFLQIINDLLKPAEEATHIIGRVDPNNHHFISLLGKLGLCIGKGVNNELFYYWSIEDFKLAYEAQKLQNI